jgi:tRNA A-37 threonylcarbamoyl transferase component Bud32
VLCERLFKGQGNIQKDNYTSVASWIVNLYKAFQMNVDATLAVSILNFYSTVKTIDEKDLHSYGSACGYIGMCLTSNSDIVPEMKEWIRVSLCKFNILLFVKVIEDIYIALSGNVMIPTAVCFLYSLVANEDVLCKCRILVNTIYLTNKFFRYQSYDVAQCVVKYINNEETHMSTTISSSLSKLFFNTTKSVTTALSAIGYTNDMYTIYATKYKSVPSYNRLSRTRILGRFEFEDFNKRSTIGEGGYGTVYSGVLGNETVAIKRQDSYSSALNEIAIMCTLSHQYIEVPLSICFEKNAFFTMSLRKMSLNNALYPRHTNELFSDHIWIKNQPRPFSHLLSKVTRRAIGKQLLEALIYLHSNGVVHNDIKPNNILLEEANSGYKVRIADFGISVYLPVADFEDMISTCTVHYRPIEHLKEDSFAYSYEVDVWACGLILSEMEVGCHPVDIIRITDCNTSKHSTVACVKKRYHQIFGTDGILEPKCLGNNSFSKLCMRMLNFDPVERITATQALFELQLCMC